MSKRFKKIYIEITNCCNLNCSFCKESNKIKKELTLDEFETILKKVDDYTDYIYLHVKGEPLLHSNLDGILKLCSKYNKKVNITTNGVLLDKKIDILINNNIRQINISLNSENNKDNYLEDILNNIPKIKAYIVLRFWALEDNNDYKFREMVKKIVAFYNLDSSYYSKIIKEDNIKIKDNIYINKACLFNWPDINSDYYNDKGYCLALKDHIGILADGTVVVCCLDGNGISNLGNIFNESMEEILQCDKVVNIISGFKNRKCYLDLCKHCSYKDRF